MKTKILDEDLLKIQKKFLDQLSNEEGVNSINWFLNLSLDEQKQNMADYHTVKTSDFFTTERFDINEGIPSLSFFLSAIGDTFSILSHIRDPYWVAHKDVKTDKELYDEENRFSHWDIKSSSQEVARFIYDFVLKGYKSKACIFFVKIPNEGKYTILIKWNQKKRKYSIRCKKLGDMKLSGTVYTNNCYHYH